MTHDSVRKVESHPIHVLDNKIIDPQLARSRLECVHTIARKIFVGGVTQATTSDDVKQYFEKFGEVEEVIIKPDVVGRRTHRGFALVVFANELAANRVCEIHFHEIKGKTVSVQPNRAKIP